MAKRALLDCVEIASALPHKKPRTRANRLSLGPATNWDLSLYTLESPEVEVPGETAPLFEDEDHQPIRVLEDFQIFDSDGRLIPFTNLVHAESLQQYQAIGVVTPYIFPDEASEYDFVDDDGIKLHLGSLTEVNFHHFDESYGVRAFDSKIYIRTHLAWYALGTPTPQYANYFRPFLVQHTVTHWALERCRKTALNFEDLRVEFREFLETKPILSDLEYIEGTPEETIGELTLTDFDDAEPHFRTMIRNWFQSAEDTTLSAAGLLRHAVIKHLAAGCQPGSISQKDGVNNGVSKTKSSKRPVAHKREKSQSQVKKACQQEATVVTRRVKNLAAAFGVEHFNDLLALHSSFINDDSFVKAEENARRKEKQIKEHPKTMYWTAPSEPELDGEGRALYTEVELDDESFMIGDFVMVLPGYDDDPDRVKNSSSKAATSINANANHFWFCQIQSLFEQLPTNWKPKKNEDPMERMMFHARWLQPGSQLILQEAAHSQELIFINECVDLHLSCIVQKVSVSILRPLDEIPEDERSPSSSKYHCAYQVGRDGGFVDVVPFSEGLGCYSCNVRAEEENQDVLAITNDPPGVALDGRTYHKGDFVYVKQGGTQQLQLAWIYRITSKTPKHGALDVTISVTFWKIGADPLFQAYVQPTTKNGSVSTSDIVGPCFVQAFESHSLASEWLDVDDHFYCLYEDVDEDGVDCCQICLEERTAMTERRRKLRKTLQPLQAMELFSGCGGLGTGLNLSGFFETRWAVELDKSAALTFQVNHPKATVFAESVNVVLEHVLRAHDDEKTGSKLLNPLGKIVEPPKKGQVGVITAGAPCQSFSRANRHKKKDDIRSTLLCSFLSYIEHYEPKMAMAENVPGMLTHRFDRDEGEVDGGMVKFLYRALMELGYQVNHKVLQAGQYGSPQSRQRVIFIAARRGYPMPNFPLPTHAFKGAPAFKQPDGTALKPLSRLRNPHPKDIWRDVAPFAPITVNQAIGDLPAFDWACPAEKCHQPYSGHIKLDAAKGQATSYPGSKLKKYASAPTHYYQKTMRSEGGLMDHQTNVFNALIVERTVHVPLKPLADHLSLPEWLQPVTTSTNLVYRRLDGNGHFRTATTSMHPQEAMAVRLHPSQRRVLSVREVARSQGFPDSYVMQSTRDTEAGRMKAKYRQLGNAVPVPLAKALGKALGEAHLLDVERSMHEDEEVL